MEKFHWNSKVPGEEGAGRGRGTGAGAGAGAGQERRQKLSGLQQQFQNFNDEEKLYWSEKLQQQLTRTQGSLKSDRRDQLLHQLQLGGGRPEYGSAASLRNNQLSDRGGGGGGEVFGSSVSLLLAGAKPQSQAQLYRGYLAHAQSEARRGGGRSQSLATRLAGYCGRPASSLGVAGGGAADCSPGSSVSVRYLLISTHIYRYLHISTHIYVSRCATTGRGTARCLTTRRRAPPAGASTGACRSVACSLEFCN